MLEIIRSIWPTRQSTAKKLAVLASLDHFTAQITYTRIGSVLIHTLEVYSDSGYYFHAPHELVTVTDKADRKMLAIVPTKLSKEHRFIISGGAGKDRKLCHHPHPGIYHFSTRTKNAEHYVRFDKIKPRLKI